MITPARINDISNEIATIYAHISDELLVNIGHHITSPTWTHTASWEIQKLAELGQLTAENAAIINKWIKAIPPELRNAMEETRKAALDEIEKQMDAAAKNGYVTPPATDSSVAVFQDMQNQAADRLNLVNTTMLQSSVDQYQRAIVLTQQEYDKLMAQQEATQRALNEGAGSVASGVETRRVAVRRAIGRISAEGLTGFIDRAGRHWTPEAYVNMDVRTTVHNTAIQATRARMNDFGTSVFQVSSHAGARPLCYPYQGKFYSWDNTAGTIELGDGSVVSYDPLNSTTYGQPAGLFGINCGHYPIPIIAGVTIPHGADNIQPEEENDKAYALSQEQRALERKIRAAKRVVEMAGDSATPEDKQKVKDAQAQMREFIAKTGRARRYDREQIGGTPQAKAVGGNNVNGGLTTNGGNANNIDTVQAPKPFAFTQGTEYAFDDLTHTVEKGYAFGNGTANGVRKTANADVYETPDGTRFVFPTSYNKRNQTLDPLTLLDAYNQIPAEIRRLGQREIVVQDVYNPQDAYWRKVYKNFSHSYAIGGKEITFWRYEYLHDHDYLVYSISHEMGHWVDWDGHYGTNRVSESQRWLDAMAADLATSGRASPTAYGENSPVEDFAESIANMGKDLAAFKSDFPNRYAILEEMLTKGSEQT